jgi:signal transduction histidine kinase
VAARFNPWREVASRELVYRGPEPSRTQSSTRTPTSIEGEVDIVSNPGPAALGPPVNQLPDRWVRVAAELWDAGTRPARVLGFAACAVIVASVVLGLPQEPPSRRPTELVLVALAAAAHVTWLSVGRTSPSRATAALTALAAVGGVLGGVAGGAAPAFAYLAAFGAARRLRPSTALAITGTAFVAMSVAGRQVGSLSGLGIVGLGVGFAAVMLGGINQAVRLRLHEQAKLLVAEGQVVVEERARSAALAERARIAREIHDVMAHSLSGLVVQLEAAALLLARDDDAARSRAVGHVDRARGLARSGLEETRRALQTLRGESLPTPELLDELVAAHAADTGCPCDLRVTGDRRGLPADVGLTVYRVAQEALTNSRKHAPGSRVHVHLDYRPDVVALTVTDHRADGGRAAGHPGSGGTGSGYGLVGMRERAELLGGELSVGPDGDGWRVDLRVPA